MNPIKHITNTINTAVQIAKLLLKISELSNEIKILKEKNDLLDKHSHIKDQEILRLQATIKLLKDGKTF